MCLCHSASFISLWSDPLDKYDSPWVCSARNEQVKQLRWEKRQRERKCSFSYVRRFWGRCCRRSDAGPLQRSCLSCHHAESLFDPAVVHFCNPPLIALSFCVCIGLFQAAAEGRHGHQQDHQVWNGSAWSFSVWKNWSGQTSAGCTLMRDYAVIVLWWWWKAVRVVDGH